MKKMMAIALILATSATSAFADGSTATPVTNQSNAMEKESGSAFSLDKFYAGFYSNLEGSKLSQLGSPDQVNETTGAMSKQAMTFATDVTAAYLVTPDIGVGTYLEMNITPVLGQGLQWLDIGVTTFDKKLVHRNGLTVTANAIVEVPTDTYDINRGMVAGLETTPSIRYEVPHSRFAVGAWTELKNYTGSTSGKLVKTYYEPYVSYALIPHLALNLSYELEYDHYAGTSGMQVYETDIQPGVLLYITPKIMINPYVQWFTNNRITADTACFGATIVARFL